MKRAQGAVEYLFMLAAAMILVIIAAGVIMDSTRNLNQAISNYTAKVRRQILENL